MPRGENRPSVLLSREENEQVFSLIGPKCQSLATAVVQLFTTEGPGHTEWKKKDTGVLCLIKDNAKRSYFFRIYCLYRKTMIWEHEVYMQIEYRSPRPYLHTFEAEEYMTAFNFANEEEARVLRNILIEKIEMRKKRREDRRHRSMEAARANSTGSNQSRMNGVAHAPPPALPPALPPAPTPAPQPVQPQKTNTISSYTLKGKKPKARKLTKADIGAPQDFKHVSHVGWDAEKGFDVGNLPEADMRSFFSKAGISDIQLIDRDTRQFIYDFINTHGGYDAVKEELHEEPPKLGRCLPPPPAPPVPSRAPHAHPPAPPSRAPPPPPARAVPPPPPPPTITAPRNPPPPRPNQPPSGGPPSVPPPPPPSAAPPAPPPPPPAPAPPPAPPMPAEASNDPRAALMESIRNGNKTLRKVEAVAKQSANEDSRSNLLSEIRQGFNLRAVKPPSTNQVTEDRPPTCGLAGALAKALQERARAIHSSDSEDSETTSDGEWDD
ncbi:unnamed protein product [Pieris macdunnoughi]|uniref:Neural Wiskott-Aldrich syndrome protein n=1 Tax=Pieris macdunnoughi TaxID=345717 RepID=A0A821UVC6_9NEOP|nr:unnamed protein product [Pieris macdunnoughi]